MKIEGTGNVGPFAVMADGHVYRDQKQDLREPAPLEKGSDTRPAQLAGALGWLALVLIAVVFFAAGMVAGVLVATLSSETLADVRQERAAALTRLAKADIQLTGLRTNLRAMQADLEKTRESTNAATERKIAKWQKLLVGGNGHDWMALPVEEKAVLSKIIAKMFSDANIWRDKDPWFYCSLLDAAYSNPSLRNDPVREFLALSYALDAGSRAESPPDRPVTRAPASPATPGKAPRRY
jgi:hypothetical protein